MNVRLKGIEYRTRVEYVPFQFNECAIKRTTGEITFDVHLISIQ